MINNPERILRIDDIGRIYIPKEIRRTMCIQEGDPLAISMKDDKIILKKYLCLASGRHWQDLVDAGTDTLYKPIAICNESGNFIAVSSRYAVLKNSLLNGGHISSALRRVMEEDHGIYNYCSQEDEFIYPTEGVRDSAHILISRPIRMDSSDKICAGMVMCMDKNSCRSAPLSQEQLVINVIADYIERRIKE